MGSLLALLAALAFQGDSSTRARDLVEKLDADRIEDREKAEKDLDSLGAAAIPELKRVQASARGEFAGRIERVLRKLVLPEPWEEKLLSTLDERRTWGVEFSTCGHVAYSVTTNQRSRVVLDGTPGEEFDDVGSITFGPDGKTLAYVGEEEKKHEVRKKQWVIAGSRKLGPYFEVGSHYRVPFVFSPDGARLAFRAANDEDKKFIVVDGKAQETFDDVDHPVFSPEGSHLAYAANRGGKHQESIYVVSGGEWFVVLDGKKGEAFDWVGHTRGEGGWPTFSPDGTRLAYQANRGKKWFMVVDGKREEEFDFLFGGPAFTPDSRHVEYSAENGKDWLLIRDGKRVTDNHPAIVAQAVSPDGAHYAYACVDQSKRWSVFVDGAPVGSFDFAYAPTFSKDGKRVAYLAHEGDDQFIIVDGRRGASFEHVGAPIFDADGKDLIYVAGRGKKQFVVWGATRGEEFDAIVASETNAICPLLRSPKSSVVAYRARVGGEYDTQSQAYVGAQWFVVVGDRKVGPFEQVWEPHFSPDGKKVAFGARNGRELWWRVVDVP